MIFVRALELFNKKGIEYIGIRELADDLDLHVGNVTYYFPRKENLVEEISLRLRKANEHTFNAFGKANLTLFDFLESHKRVFQNQYQYRCLPLSFVQLLRNYPNFYRRYKLTEQERWNSLRSAILSFRQSGQLATSVTDEEIGDLVSLCSFISRLWLSEASVSFREKKIEWIIAHYLALLARVVEPHTSSKGKKEVVRFLATLRQDEERQKKSGAK
ncbi:MAG: TetR/AcrR family transcriptional regulator [Chitinophagales bacterium]